MSQNFQEDITITNVPEWNNTRILMAKNTSRKWRIYHETYTVCIVESERAHGELFYRGETQPIQPGDVMLMEPGELHVTRKIEGLASFQTFFIDPHELTRLAEERDMPGQPHFHAARLQHPVIFDIFRCLTNSLSANNELGREIAWYQAINSLFEHAIENKPSIPARHSNVALMKAKDFLIENCNERIALGDLADVAGMSRYHFIREFKRLFGLTPHAYLNEIRLSHLRCQLRQGVPIGEIITPFFDESHIHYHFKRSLGVTPRKYAQPPISD